MSGWGILKNASEKEKIKSEMADYLHGLNSCCKIDIELYDEMFDFSMVLFDRMFEHGVVVGKLLQQQKR